MDNKYKKGAFIITLILFVISLPFTVMGIIYHRQQTGSDNVEKKFHYNNKLYFYDTSKNLIGTYACKYSNCGYADEVIADNEYGINYFKLTLLSDKIIDKRYAILSDYKDTQEEIIIYDIKNSKELGRYKEYKIYNVGIENNYIIVKDNKDLYGVIQITNNSIKEVIPFEYEFIGLPNKIEKSKISSENFIVLQNNLWSLINETSKLTVEYNNPIVDYDDSTVITKSASNYSLLSYNGNSKLSGEYKRLNYVGNCLEVMDFMNNYYLLNKSTLTKVSNNYTVNDNSVIGTKADNNGNIQIIIDNETKETVEI